MVVDDSSHVSIFDMAPNGGFSRAFFGYDKSEVERFIDRQETEIERLRTERNDARAALAETTKP